MAAGPAGANWNGTHLAEDGKKTRLLITNVAHPCLFPFSLPHQESHRSVFNSWKDNLWTRTIPPSRTVSVVLCLQ